MDQIDTCDICGLKVKGKRYEFYYGQFLGTSDFVQGSTGMGNRWKEHYHVLGKSSCFFCRKCISREYWKRVFSEPRLPEMQVGWFDFLFLWLGVGLGVGLVAGLVKLAGLVGLTISKTASGYLVLICVAFGVTAVLMASKLLTYADEFGNEMAYSTRFKELPNIPKLVCIPPSKYKYMKPPTASLQEEPKLTVKTPIQKETPKIRQVAKSASENICSKCGNVGLPKDRFCRKCGSSLK